MIILLAWLLGRSPDFLISPRPLASRCASFFSMVSAMLIMGLHLHMLPKERKGASHLKYDYYAILMIYPLHS